MNELVEFLYTEIGPYFGSRQRKPLRQQWRDMRDLWLRYRCIPYHYFKHRLYERAARPDFIDYMPSRIIKSFRLAFNPRSHVRMLNDKREAVGVLAGSGIRCVETLFSVSAEGTVLRSDGVTVDTNTAVEALRARGGTLFVKPIDSHAGHGAFSIRAASVDTAFIASQRNVVIQPVLRNHPIIEAMSPNALNTVRIATLVTDGRCTLLGACLRVAQGKSVVDNWAHGGIAIGVDLRNGALNPTGVTKAKYGRRVYAAHPDTGVRFDSITLPWWRETRQLAERAALGLLPHATLGLDIAITPDGPVFIEANESGDFFLLQEACGPLAGSDLGRAALANWLHPRTPAPAAQPR